MSIFQKENKDWVSTPIILENLFSKTKLKQNTKIISLWKTNSRIMLQLSFKKYSEDILRESISNSVFNIMQLSKFRKYGEGTEKDAKSRKCSKSRDFQVHLINKRNQKYLNKKTIFSKVHLLMSKTAQWTWSTHLSLKKFCPKKVWVLTWKRKSSFFFNRNNHLFKTFSFFKKFVLPVLEVASVVSSSAMKLTHKENSFRKWKN